MPRPDLDPHSEEWQDRRKVWREQHRRMHGWHAHRRNRPILLRVIFTVLVIWLLTRLAIFVLSPVRHMMMGTRPMVSPLELITVIALGIGLFSVVIWIGSRFIGRFTTPLDRVIRAAEEVADGDLNARVEEVPGGGGVSNLTRTFNRMVDELQRADQQRRNLTADVAHELRTPVHILQGHLEGILDGVYTADEATLNTMLEETNQLTRMIDDLQTLTLAEAGQLHLHIESVDVADLIGDVVTSFSPQAEAAEISLTSEAAAGLVVEGDADRLDQVLSNLVANALRYVPAGGSITLTAQGEGEGVLLQVTDTGSGIPAEDLPYVFERFYRADKARTRQGGGAGLGLAISKQLVEAHGGTIEVTSEVGQGTTFTMWLPVSGFPE